MKKLISLAIVVMLSLCVTACAKKPMTVKCPACQHQFDVPTEN